jgi:phosphotransferase system HPr (HPr) family protein
VKWLGTVESGKAHQFVEKNLMINNELGLHARPAGLFIHKARQFTSEILIEKDRKRAGGNSITDILAPAVASRS